MSGGPRFGATTTTSSSRPIPGNFDFVNVEHGFLNTSFVGPAPTTYLELTAGLNITVPIPDGTPVLKGMVFRPEVRYDSSLNGTTPFGGGGGILGIPGTPGFGVGTKSSQVTFGGDVVVEVLSWPASTPDTQNTSPPGRNLRSGGFLLIRMPAASPVLAAVPDF